MRRSCLSYVYIFAVLFNIGQREILAKNLVVATYNLWNVMFQWDMRKYYIADMIREANVDVIGFQEVRADLHGKRNQLKDLQQLLPEYKYSSFHVTRTVEKRFGEKSITGWEKEGIGILSKHSIVISHQIPLSRADNNDQSPRALLHTQIQYEMHEIFFIVVHFSTSKELQCQNALRVINFIASAGADRTIIAGDFNTYLDYNWPMEAVQNGFFLPRGCPIPPDFTPVSDGQYGFDDSWSETNADKTNFGLTFSNMPSPGLINRPDRLLVSRVGLDPVKSTLLGRGEGYNTKYSTSSYITRLRTTISMAKLQWYGHDVGYSCYLDCGPHGSCRCGVCVGGGNNLNCDLAQCSDCTASHYKIVLILYYTTWFYVVLSVYVLVGIFVKYSRYRTLKKFLLFGKWFRLKYLVLLVLIGISLFLVLIKIGLAEMVATAFNRLPEEMYPSDHLMVVSEVKITYH